MTAKPKPTPLNDTEEESAAGSTGSARLKTGGGDGTFGGMEARVAKLEAHMEHVLQDVSLIRSDVGTLKTDMAATKVKIENLPSKEFVVKVVVGSATVLGAIQVFGPSIAKLFGLR
ncbi:hypothetical protein [uncultured Caulobacter sp.]|uniref:hypothetical protein n=1 Tax=uncultured Caulobacter sp. TaxID=158749 RepID=UPI00262F0669|nr:hypothetical protein [uncultured Caulobacter sp.]